MLHFRAPLTVFWIFLLAEHIFVANPRGRAV